MGRSISRIILSLVIIIITGCEHPGIDSIEPPTPPPPPGYSVLEKTIRSRYDHRAVFTWKQYTDLLITLSDPRFIVLPINEMRKTFDQARVVVGLRHDIDWNPFKALEMANIENEFGIRATYYILPTADYYGNLDKTGLDRFNELDSLYIRLMLSGAEVGIHNDLLTVMIDHKLDPFLFNQSELLYFRSLSIPIYGTASHGSPIAKATVPNYQIFSDYAQAESIEYMGKTYSIGERSLSDYGFEYEAYFVPFNLYYSESGGRWNDIGGFSSILSKLRSSVPGDRIQILVHPDWWGKTN